MGLPADWVFSLAVDPADPRTVYAAVYRRGVFRSTDGGATWASLGPGLEGLTITTLLVDHAPRSAPIGPRPVRAIEREPRSELP